jgi:hypothetical protein
MNNHYYAQRYWLKAKIMAQVLAMIPFVRMIGLTGSLAQGKANQNSDIDFMIVAEKGWIWTVRFLSTLLVILAGQRRSNKKTAGKFCLNRYLTTVSLIIYPQNHYHAQDYSLMVPLVDSGGIYDQYWRANYWINQYCPFPKKYFPVGPNIISRFIQKLTELIYQNVGGRYLEKKLGQWQKRKILNNPLTQLAPEKIVANDRELRFHPPKI